MKKISLLLSFSLPLFCCVAFAASRPAAEVEALLAIKSALVDPSGILHDWKAGPDAHHCNWTGVRCNPEGSVERLDLSRKNLSGRISNAIGQLPSLVYLNLCCNSFASALPETMSNLSRLKAFDVSDNLFAGQFPAGLGSAAELRTVNASGNNFSGKLPEDMGNATLLESLDLRGGYFQGSIPASFRRLQKLKFLGLSGNNLTGPLPAELGELSSLETLIIGYNEFHGPIPPELGNLTSLRYLDLAVGSLSGAIPPELGRLQNLDTVYLFKNRFDGEIPREVGNISSLALLDLSDNQINGSIPAELSQLPNLQLLNLMCNRLVGPIPAAFGQLGRLQVLELWNNSLVGELPANLGKNSSLVWLDASSNSLSGQIPDGLCDGGNLTKLILFNNELSGSIPASLAACTPLVRVRMHNNRINGTIPAGLGKLPRIQRLELAGNELTGEVPDDLASSVSLSFIDISHNRLRSSLPPNILSIPNLQTFVASGNELTGGFPSEFSCPALTVLDLSNNRLSGAIPASLASCQRLVNLDLSNNSLSGEISPAIATMPTLSILDLSSNQLTGSIPTNFGTSPALETLNLSYNRLSGPVPSNGVLRTINPDELAGNLGLCGGVLPPCPGASTPGSLRQKSIHLRHIVAGWAIGISVIFAFGVLLLGTRWVYHWYLDGGCCDRFDREIGGEWPWRLTAFQRLSFTSTELLACIKEPNVIGMGATGVVYKADLPRHHTTVAVKKLWRAEPGRLTYDGTSEDIVAEVNLLGRLRHRNIVRMLGLLRNAAEAMVVYEYMPNGSLWEALHGKGEGGRRGPALLADWVSRYNVAAGVAAGLAYLHHDCRPPVIHRDVKSSNILLDGSMEARIADFGLAKSMARKNETVSVVAGSYGYIAPEYGYTLKVDQKSDIYSFGVVLMELLTGKKPIETEFGECQDIVGWVREKLRSNKGVEEVLDPDVGGQCKHVQEEMLLVLRIAVLCTARSPKDRPSMRDVITMLAEAKPRRKSSSSNSAVVNTVVHEKPVFTTAPESEFL